MESTLSSLTIRKLLPEIKEETEGKYLGKAQQLDNNTYRFRFSPGSIDLIIEIGKRLNITDYRLKAPKKATQPSMILRKHLSNSKLEKIEQVGFDRIVEMTFTNGKKIIIELFAEGNLILTDDKDKIIFTHRTKEWRDREIRKGEKYTYPPSQLKNPFKVDQEQFKEALSGKSIVASIATNLGLGGDIAEEICRKAEIDKNKTNEQLNEKELEKLYRSMEDLLKKDRNPVKQDGKIRPFPISGEVQERYDSLNTAIDENYKGKTESEKEPEDLIKLKKRLESQKESIKEFKDKIDKYKKKGDAIYKNYSKVGKAIQLYKEGKTDKLKEELDAEIKNRKIKLDLN